MKINIVIHQNSEKFNELTRAYGDQIVIGAQVFWCYKVFSDGGETAED